MNSFTRKIHRLEDLRCLKIERELRQDLLLKMSLEQTKQELADAAHTDDARLIELLLQAGFTAETLPALSLAPIALVAWGSGYVTADRTIKSVVEQRTENPTRGLTVISDFQSVLFFASC